MGGGDFNVKHFLDPLGVTIGKGQGGGAKDFWDPANIFTPGKDTPAATPSPTAPTPTPPVSPDSSAITNVQWNLRRDQLNRKGISATVYAGATGGWMPTSSQAGMGSSPSVSTGPTKTG